METRETIVATIEYRSVLVRPRSHSVLAYYDAGRYRLPRIQITAAARRAQQMQKEIKAKWGLNVFVLVTWVAPDGTGACAVAERLTPELPRSLREILVEQLTISELSEEDRLRLELLFDGRPKSPLSRIGWIDEGIAWIRSVTGSSFSSKSNIEQWNAGEGFVLLRACSDDGRNYWLKATDKPNVHELAMTSLLCELCSEFVPKVIAVRREWNAWLTEDAGVPFPDSPDPGELQAAATSLARLQLLIVGRTDEFLIAGAFDQRLPTLRSHIGSMTDNLIAAMERQSSLKASPLSRDRMRELAEILRDACLHLEALDIPDTLIHNDLNPANILWDGTKYVFTDWSEAAIGNPFLSCERLCLLNRAHALSAQNVYRKYWSQRIATKDIDKAIALAPLLAIYAYLYGRGDWLKRIEGVRPQFESYRRSLARHMDRAAKDPSLLEVLCRR